MRYLELWENSSDAAQQQVDAQKDRAKTLAKTAKRAKEQAKAADLRLKQKQTQDMISKINTQS